MQHIRILGLVNFIVDLVILPGVFLSALCLKLARWLGLWRIPISRKVLLGLGIYPIRNHYYEPLFKTKHLRERLGEKRFLPGIDWNIEEQLQLLRSISTESELLPLAEDGQHIAGFHFNNQAFEAGDAEFWYNLVRLKKPENIIEIGSGFSTLLAKHALLRNVEEDVGYHCRHICIEPYEMSWLEQSGVEVIRQKVEDLDPGFFSILGENDILFIDSSHIIRPCGDVLFEYLSVLPGLNPGVIVHVHDIFSPRDYPAEWIVDEIRLWNEQYLLEAFLTSNSEWRIIAALSMLSYDHRELLSRKCIFMASNSRPGSFYMQKNA